MQLRRFRVLIVLTGSKSRSPYAPAQLIATPPSPPSKCACPSHDASHNLNGTEISCSPVEQIVKHNGPHKNDGKNAGFVLISENIIWDPFVIVKSDPFKWWSDLRRSGMKRSRIESPITSWWFQPIWKNISISQIGSFVQVGVKIKIFETTT